MNTAKIVTQGTPHDNDPSRRSTQVDPKLAGKYVVVHGNVTLAHPGEGKPPIVAFEGATVELGAEDAHHMLAAGTVMKAEDAEKYFAERAEKEKAEAARRAATAHRYQ